MPVFDNAVLKVLYLHVPKTGGSTIEAWLRRYGPLQFYTTGVPVALRCTPQHFRMSDFRALFGEGYFDHVFMTVRDPYERIASEYRMRAILSGKSFWKSYPTFSYWLETTLNSAASNPFHLDNHIRPQWEFFGSGVEVLKYELGLPAICTRIAEVIGLPVPSELPHVYGTSAADIEVSFDEIDRMRIQEFYRKDFEIFGYSF